MGFVEPWADFWMTTWGLDLYGDIIMRIPINPCHVGSQLFWADWVNIIAADALAKVAMQSR